jgi:hypothetical protein
MPLASNLFSNNPRLEDCLVDHQAHVTVGSVGEHVRLIQIAVTYIDGGTIDAGELATQTYGESTAAAVLAYKKRRKIINPTYQTTEDNIVGKMTIASLDKEMFDREYTPGPAGPHHCRKPPGGLPPRPVRKPLMQV